MRIVDAAVVVTAGVSTRRCVRDLRPESRGVLDVCQANNGLGDTRMEPYRDRIVGLEEEGRPLPESWGFDEEEGQDARSER